MLRLNRCLYLLFLVLLAVVSAPSSVHAQARQKALLVGGGTRPPEAMKYLKSWSVGKPHSENVLIVTWATSMPDETFSAASQDLKAAGFTQTQEAVRFTTPLGKNARQTFLAQLSQASTVFFSGGDQNEFMKAAKSLGVVGDLQKAYQEGTAVAGTSAGTAVMAQEMFTGDEDITKISRSTTPEEMVSGVGFFDFLIDQHFVKRMRWARLFSALLGRPEKNGLGVDESTAVALETEPSGEVRARVFGEGTVISVSPEASSLKVSFYQAGESFTVPHFQNSNPK